jgi:hypothetical protein
MVRVSALELLPTGLGRSGLAEVGGFCFDGRLFWGSPIMPKALSIDLRERVIAAIEAGASCHQAAERLPPLLGVADFKSEWPRSNRNQWPTSFRNRRPTSPGICSFFARRGITRKKGRLNGTATP